MSECSVSGCPKCALREWCDRPENQVATNLEMLIQKLKALRDPNFRVV